MLLTRRRLEWVSAGGAPCQGPAAGTRGGCRKRRTVLCVGDAAVGQLAELLGLWDSGLDAVVLDERGDHVSAGQGRETQAGWRRRGPSAPRSLQHGLAVRSGAPQLAESHPVPHRRGSAGVQLASGGRGRVGLCGSAPGRLGRQGATLRAHQHPGARCLEGEQAPFTIRWLGHHLQLSVLLPFAQALPSPISMTVSTCRAFSIDYTHARR